MTRLLTCGWESGNNYEGFGAWGGNAPVIFNPNRGYGTNGIYLSGNSGSLGGTGNYIGRSFTASSEIYLRCAVVVDRNGDNSQGRVITLNHSGSGSAYVMRLWQAQRTTTNGAGDWYWTKGSGGTTWFAYTDNGWHIYEIYVKNTVSDYQVKIKMDGNLLVNYSDATGISPYNIDTVVLGAEVTTPTSGSITDYFDELAINNSAGSVNNSWIGDGAIWPLVPNADGSKSELTGSDGNQVNNYLLVDDVPYNSDTDYVATELAGLTDFYDTSSPTLATGETVSAVHVDVAAKRNNANSLNIQPGVRSGATETFLGTSTLSTAYGVYFSSYSETNPDTGLPWTPAEIAAIQVGVKTV